MFLSECLVFSIHKLAKRKKAGMVCVKYKTPYPIKVRGLSVPGAGIEPAQPLLATGF
jgi:hypothetical protein